MIDVDVVAGGVLRGVGDGDAGEAEALGHAEEVETLWRSVSSRSRTRRATLP
jgi:hypothetical protein